ncbi:hypothetical protein L228DRAFT_284827 [Xylona heveae TC161]|uniref:Peptidase A22B, signal peptide peptidase n=1 Tax=Xylona heveae (strain CBS 132557 / TC161) TaxID=1328760 RepID=A0A165FFI9_XYLHT|nr:hypothetical protein L228DRAFT_284827 [Xylona heveae TC161]KZF20917.1 hypothetical protein L228DRAFT_284827 [Xylona heveae TC161]
MGDHGRVAEILGRIAYEFSLIQPFLPTYLHLLASALFPIYAGSHASLSRPTSAAKRGEHRSAGKVDTSHDSEDESDEDETEEVVQKLEGFSPSDAITIPVFAGTVLAGLYFLIKWLKDPSIINKLLNWYFSVFGVFTVARLVGDTLKILTSFVFPKRWADGGMIWRISKERNKIVRAEAPSESHSVSQNERSTPLPGRLSRLSLSSQPSRLLWLVRSLLTEHWTLIAYTRIFNEALFAKMAFGIQDVTGFVVGLAVVVYYNTMNTSWFLTNLMGFGFSYGALQLMSPTTFWTGTLILGALFFYDIYFVFFTPIMVTVATSLDIPIKLLFPRPAAPGTDPSKTSLAMLGLGDVVLPGIMIGLALRFDLYMHYKRKQTRQVKRDDGNGATSPEKEPDHSTLIKAKYVCATGGWGERFWVGRSGAASQDGSFSKPYFHASLAGYILGMIATVGVMQIAGHAQPALLYLVPGVLGAIWGTALVRGEIKEMWNFSEAGEDNTSEKHKKDEEKESASAKSPVQREQEKESSEEGEKSRNDGEKAVSSARNKHGKDRPAKFSAKQFLKERAEKNDLVYFTITAPRLTTPSTTKSPETANAKEKAGARPLTLEEELSLAAKEENDSDAPCTSSKHPHSIDAITDWDYMPAAKRMRISNRNLK